MTVEILDSIIAEAVANGVAAVDPSELGDHSVIVNRPAGWVTEVIDLRPHEDNPRERVGQFGFSTVESLVRYVNRYKSYNTLGYMKNATTVGPNALTAESQLVHYMLDDFDENDITHIANRKHLAKLVLQPTPAARRWGNALQNKLTQIMMVELVIDGTSEIAAPDSALLRDLVSDLHAIRSSSAKSIVRTNGGLAVELAENVTLHAGTGSLVTVPDTLTLVLQPWSAVDATITVDVKIRPIVNGDQVLFALSAPQLEDELNVVLQAVHAELTTGTDIEPYWSA